MPLTGSDVLADVRVLINDTSSISFRYTDPTLLQLLNNGLKLMALVRPDLFDVFVDVPTTAGAVMQSAPVDCIRVMEVLRVTGGNALTEGDRQTMDQMTPSWPVDAAGPAQLWMRHPRSEVRFFIYPPAPGGQAVLVQYVASPHLALVSSPIPCQDGFAGAVVAITVALTQSVDDEHINTGRAKFFLDMFNSVLGTNLQLRQLTDGEAAALPKGTYP